MPHAVLARLPEFASRIAMVLAVLAQPEAEAPTVTGEIARVAVLIADESARVFSASLAANQRPAWDDPEAQAKYVLSASRRSDGSLSRADLLRACRRLTSRTIGEVLTRLAEEKEIVVLKEGSTGGREKEVIALNDTYRQFE